MVPHADIQMAGCSYQQPLTALPVDRCTRRGISSTSLFLLITCNSVRGRQSRRAFSGRTQCQQSARSPETNQSAAGIGRGRLVRAISGTILAPLLQFRWPGSAEAASAELPLPPPGQALMRTLHDSQLAVATYPTFTYNALGGGGLAKATQDGDIVHLTFDPATLNIPDVNYRNTTFMGVPMAPPFSIAVQPRKLEGFVDRKTGKAELTFLADFLFTAGPLYKAPPLVVTTVLTTESVQGDVQGGTGQRMNEDGYAKLVGVARLDPTKDVLLDKFLMLPNDCKAVMSCQFAFNPASA